jgi:hypothetical protein
LDTVMRGVDRGVAVGFGRDVAVAEAEGFGWLLGRAVGVEPLVVAGAAVVGAAVLGAADVGAAVVGAVELVAAVVGVASVGSEEPHAAVVATRARPTIAAAIDVAGEL